MRSHLKICVEKISAGKLEEGREDGHEADHDERVHRCRVPDLYYLGTIHQRWSRTAFLNSNQSLAHFLPRPVIFGLRQKSIPA